MPVDAGLVRFARGLVAGQVASRRADIYSQPDGRRAKASDVERLMAAGVVSGNQVECRSNKETSGWLRRQLLGGDAFGDQHRVLSQGPDGTTVNLAESPLMRLGQPTRSEPAFLERHHVETGERVRRFAERAQLTPRLTMAYSASRTAGGSSKHRADITDLASDARRSLAEIYRILPYDCAAVVLDVCGLLKGLQDVEREREWPRRSAKLVLRIGLDRLSEHYGISPFAVGRKQTASRKWMDGDRPERFE